MNSRRRYADPKDELNSSKYHTGKKCVVPGCDHPAGTAWSDFFCQFHNTERMDRINQQFEDISNDHSKNRFDL